MSAMQSEMEQIARRLPKFPMNATSLWLSRLLTPKWMMSLLARLLMKAPQMPANIQVEDIFIPGPDRNWVRLRIYRPQARASQAPALLWMHGGGYITGLPEQNDFYIVPYVQEAGLVVVSVDYRLAPEHPFPAPLEDCYAALQWLAAQAGTFGVDPQRIAIGGSSAGAGLAAALAQLAHDRGEILPAFQLLIYPMLDDRTAARKDIAPKANPVWDNASNRFGWESYLNQPCGAETAPAYAVPARRAGHTGLPPAWIGVGTHDLFYDESVAYAHRLHQAGVPCELIIVPGAFHAFDLFAPELQAVEEFRQSQVQALKNALVG